MSTTDARPPLPDHADREAIRGRAPGSLDRTIFVDAGAGTGKTSALVDRVVELLGRDVPVRDIAAITFTEAAAAELRHRVREEVEKAGRERQDERFVRAAGDLDDAAFTTLHAFAQGILLDDPVAADLPPEVEMLADLEAEVAFEEWWDSWLTDFVNDGDARPLLIHLDAMGLSVFKVRQLASALHDNYHRIPTSMRVRPGPYTPPPLDLTDVRRERAELAAICEEAAALDVSDKLVVVFREVLAAADHLIQLVDRGDATTLMDKLEAIDRVADIKRGGGGKKGAWEALGGAKENRDRLKAFQEVTVPGVKAGQFDALLRTLAAWVGSGVATWAEQRRRAGRLVFQDLLVLARDLLRDDVAVRRAVRARYRFLLIDEFQDTDPLQIELAVLLGAADPEHAGSWLDAEITPGRLFLVGDPKQSIYRFRGADIAVYEAAKAFIDQQGTGTELALSHNFRSVPGILAWVNRVFGALLQAREGAQPAYRPLTGDRSAVGSAAVVRTIGGPGGSASEAREREAADVARVITELVGTTVIEDPVTRTPRPARRHDIAVLVRRHATARLLERELEDRDIPHVIESRTLLFGTPEVRDLTLLLTAVDDPTDEVAVVGALRHPSFGCSDDDLVTWRADRGTFRLPSRDHDTGGARNPTKDHPVARGLELLAQLHALRDERTVGGLTEHLITELRLRELGLATTRPRDRWRRLRFVADQAHAWHDAGGHLRGFVRWLQEQADQGVRRDEHIVPDRDDDAVRITTVHAAKGLEYPIVIVLGLDTMTGRALHDPRLLWSDADVAAGAGTGGVEPTIEVNLNGDARTAGFSELNEVERLFHAEEEQRLFYVAATRARDHLVISLHHGERNAGCHAAWLSAQTEFIGELWEELPLPATGEQDSLFAPDPVVSDDTVATGSTVAEDDADHVADLVAFKRDRAAAAAAATRPRVLAATTIARHLADLIPDGFGSDDEVAPSDDHTTDDATVEPAREQPWRKGRGGTAVGRAVHAVLQSADLSDESTIAALARAQCAAEGLPPDQAPRIAEMAARALTSDAVIAAVTSGRYWREIHVGAPIGDVTVEGFIDLLYEDADGLVVADYKTDSLTTRTPEEAIARYRPQAATYALALEAALGTPVARCVFVLTQAKRAAERDVVIDGEVLRAAVADLRARLESGEVTASAAPVT